MIKRRKQGGFLRTLLALFGGLIALIVIAALVVSLIKIPINVSSYKGLVESTASDALGRTVKVDGDMTVTTSLWPYFEIQGIRIANPEGFEKGDLASMELARISVELLPLLDRKIQIEAFRVDGLALNLVRNERGDVNWVLTGATPAEKVDAGSETAPPTLASDALAVDELVLENISVTFRDASDQKELEFIMEKAAGSAAYGEPMVLSMNGVLLDEPFTLDVEANSLAEFLAMARSRLEFEIDIADTRFRFAGLSDALGSNRTTELDVAVEGERLDSLDDLLRLDLPPLVDYRLAAHLTVSPGRLELTDLEANVKDSALNGTVVVDRTGAKPFATMQLTADTIQLTDFDTGDWSADEPDS